MGRMLDALADRRLELGPAAHAERTGNFRVAFDDDKVMWILLDRPDKAVNTVDRSVIEELSALVDRIVAEKPAAVLLRSAKPSGFVAGADIQQFVGASTADIQAMLEQAHVVLNRLAVVDARTIAVIHGHCLGAGLELALACDIRIAVADASLGFPEVMLGLHPGLGGTYRATAVADPLEAMTMMLTGKPARAKTAKAIGLVDAVVEERHVAAAVEAARLGDIEPSGGSLKRDRFRVPSRSGAGRQPDAQTDRREGTEGTLSRALPADRSVGGQWRRCQGHAGRRDAELRRTDRDRDFAQSRPRLSSCARR